MNAGRLVVAIAALTLVAGAAAAGEERVKLKEGPGVEKVRANCVPCHSLDYIRLNSPFLDAKGWQGEVNKMVKSYGAPVPPDDVRPIVEYLAKQYGTEQAQKTASPR
jgi:mono/diheme cytochrome c family protein